MPETMSIEIKEKKAEIKNNLHSLIFKMSQIVPLNAAQTLMGDKFPITNLDIFFLFK